MSTQPPSKNSRTNRLYTLTPLHLIPAILHSSNILKLAVPVMLVPALRKIIPPGLRRPAYNAIPSKAMKNLARAVDVMRKTSFEILETKRRAFAAGEVALSQLVGEGKDIMSVLGSCFSRL